MGPPLARAADEAAGRLGLRGGHLGRGRRRLGARSSSLTAALHGRQTDARGGNGPLTGSCGWPENALAKPMPEMGRAGIEPATLGLKVTSGGCGRVRRSRENALNQRVSQGPRSSLVRSGTGASVDPLLTPLGLRSGFRSRRAAAAFGEAPAGAPRSEAPRLLPSWGRTSLDLRSCSSSKPGARRAASRALALCSERKRRPVSRLGIPKRAREARRGRSAQRTPGPARR
jgi:hypothetical protein